ncbi:hypothetical protein KY332_00060 [Candidatus Woesearchaeota archaeon]|nr:hypothetical protein [Candidatus Woesearchaeota archaeon]
MKQVGLCQNCGREVYVNDIDLCKRCHQEVGIEILNKLDYVDEPEEEGPDMEALGLESEGSVVTESEGDDEEEEKPDPADEPQKVKKKE